VDEVSKIGDAGEDAVWLALAADCDAKLLFDANGKFELVKGVEAKAAAHMRPVGGEAVRAEYVEPEDAGDQIPQVREQQVVIEAAVSHPATLSPEAEDGHGV
jgi:hypothetical protein